MSQEDPGHPPPAPALCLCPAWWCRHGHPFFLREHGVQGRLCPFQGAMFIQRFEEGEPQAIEDSIHLPLDHPLPTRTG